MVEGRKGCGVEGEVAVLKGGGIGCVEWVMGLEGRVRPLVE